MKKIAIFTFLGFMAVAALGCSVLCDKLCDKQLSPEFVEKMKAEVVRVQSNSFKALIQGDVKTLDSLLTDDYFSYGGDVELGSKEVILKGLANGDLKYESMEVDNKKFELLAPNVAMISGSGHAIGKYKKVDFSGGFRFMTIYNLENDVWKAMMTAVIC